MTRTSLLILGATAAVTFALIVLVIVPQTMLVQVRRPAEMRPYTAQEARGREVYIENGCIYCHSQQIRDTAFTTDVDRGWGRRPTVPADYYFDRPHLLGTMRTGPDLINVGQRLPDPEWHLIHFFNPRAVVAWSIMPPLPHLFEIKPVSARRPQDRLVAINPPFVPPNSVVVATPDALALTAYVMSLSRQYPITDADRPTMRTLGAPSTEGSGPTHQMP